MFNIRLFHFYISGFYNRGAMKKAMPCRIFGIIFLVLSMLSVSDARQKSKIILKKNIRIDKETIEGLKKISSLSGSISMFVSYSTESSFKETESARKNKKDSLKKSKSKIQKLMLKLDGSVKDGKNYYEIASEYYNLENLKLSFQYYIKSEKNLLALEKQFPEDNKIIEYLGSIYSVYAIHAPVRLQQKYRNMSIAYKQRLFKKTNDDDILSELCTLYLLSGDYHNADKIIKYLYTRDRSNSEDLFLSFLANFYFNPDKSNKNFDLFIQKLKNHDVSTVLNEQEYYKYLLKVLSEKGSDVKFNSIKRLINLTAILFKVLVLQSEDFHKGKPLNCLSKDEIKILNEIGLYFLSFENKEVFSEKYLYNWLGVVEFLKRDFDKALIYFKKSYFYDRDRSMSGLIVYIQVDIMHKYHDAHNFINVKISSNPEANDYFWKAFVYYSENKYNDALSFLLKAAAMEKSNLYYKYNIAAMYLKLDKLTEAEKMCETILKIDKNFEEIDRVYMLLAVINLINNDIDASYQNVNNSLNKNPDSERAVKFKEKYFELVMP